MLAMRERQFINENKKKWKEFEELIDRKEHDPERLGELFIHVTDDLSYARTFYPNRSVRVYLNKLAQQVFDRLYRKRPKSGSRVIRFFTEEIPAAVFHSRRELLLSLIIFVLSIGAGVLSGVKNPDFARSILGDSYVEMTEENISNNDPMAVYKDDNQFYVFAYIALNNLKIDFYTFVSGLFFGLWTIMMLIVNGVMVGSFQYFFAERGLFSESFLTIWMHGALELSAVVIAGGAGLILGRGIVFPGTYSRIQSLMISARQGLKILLVAVLMTTVAAVIESFLTRYTGIPNIVRFLFILLSFTFVIGYFVVLPYWKSKRGTILPVVGERIGPDLNHEIDSMEVKGVGKLFSEGFIIYKEVLGRYMVPAVLIAFVYTAVCLLLSFDRINSTFSYYPEDIWSLLVPAAWTFGNFGMIFSPQGWNLLLLSNLLLLTACFFVSFYLLKKYLLLKKMMFVSEKVDWVSMLISGFILSGLILGLGRITSGWVWVFLISPIPLFMVAFSGWLMDETDMQTAIGRFRSVFFKACGLYLSFILIGFILFTLITFPAFNVVLSISEILFGVEGMDMNRLFIGIYLFFTALALLLIIPPMIMGMSMAYYSGRELNTAEGLRAKMSTILIEESSKEHLR